MPISAHAMQGIEDFGHKWRLEINLMGQPKRLADPDALKVGDCAEIRDVIAGRVRQWLAWQPIRNRLGEDAVYDFECVVDDLEQAEDDPDDLRREMNRLYDQFDYYRVCVVS